MFYFSYSKFVDEFVDELVDELVDDTSLLHGRSLRFPKCVSILYKHIIIPY